MDFENDFSFVWNVIFMIEQAHCKRYLTRIKPRFEALTKYT